MQLIDEAPDGSRTYLQRGHAEGEPPGHRHEQERLTTRPATGLYRPWRPHTNPHDHAGRAYEYLVEVFPVGHVFRPGHRLLVKISAPPAATASTPTCRRVPGVNTVFHDDAHRARLMLPVVPVRHANLGPELTCGELARVRCIAA